jgi:hypothetical protein
VRVAGSQGRLGIQMVLALILLNLAGGDCVEDLNTAMNRLVLGKDWLTKRMKALRLRLIGLPGRAVNHARKLIIRLEAGAEVLGLIVSARQTIRALACGPAG